MTWLAVLQSRWTHYALLAVACWFLWERGNNHEARADNCEIARANDRKAYELASKEAEAKAIAQKQAVEAHYSNLARKADAEHHQELESALRATERYARTHRVRAQDVASESGGTVAPSEGGSPGSPDSPGGETFLVAITQRDLNICTKNTLRLEGAHDWAKALNLVSPDPAFGQPESP